MRLPRSTASLQDFLHGMAEEIDAQTLPVWDDTAPIWEPIAGGPQVRAYDSLADELFYGGAGGGGKTDLLLGLSFTKHRRSIIFRREYGQFKGAGGMWERAKEIVGLRGTPTENPLMVRGLPGGRAVEFGAVQREEDWAKYKGRPHDLKGFDELPEFTELQYRALIGWLRTTVRGQRTRVVSTGNPPTTSEGQWVIKYWGPWLDPTHPNPAKDGELRWYANVGGEDVERPDGEPFMDTDPDGRPMKIYPRSRTFIRARVEDNPYYMRTGYDQVLNSLPEPLRSQLRFGDFQKTVADNPWQVCPTAWVVAAQARWRADGGRDFPLSQVGNDPSRGGTDEFVIAKRHGDWVGPLVVHPATAAPDGPHGAALVYKAIGGEGGVPVMIDIIGTAGSSVYDHCKGLKLNAIALNGSEKSLAKDKSGKLGFANLRAEIHWKMRELLDPANGHDIALPPDAQLRSDLCAPRWSPTPRGIQIESKDDIKARLGRSPDRGEAVMYACVSYAPEQKKVYKSATWR